MIIKEEPEISRAKLSQRVCEEFKWRSSNGRLNEMSCRVALLELERTGQVVLPEPGTRPPRKTKDNGSEIKENLSLIESAEGGPIGFLVHDTMAFTLEGTPSGLLNVQNLAAKYQICRAQFFSGK